MSLMPDQEAARSPDLRQVLHRIEAKLDALFLALAEDEPEQEQAFDLEGQPMSRERDPNEPL